MNPLHRRLSVGLVALMVTTLACGEDAEDPATGKTAGEDTQGAGAPGEDAALRADAINRDGAGLNADAITAADATGPADSGSTSDTLAPDAGPVDSGASDAGAPDAAAPDAGPPADITAADASGPNLQGKPCKQASDCPSPLFCLGAPTLKTGVCTAICSPGKPGDCGAGYVCRMNPMSSAPGACMLQCKASGDCPSPLSCSAYTGTKPEPATGGCFPWPVCDPVNDWFCEPGKQCHLVAGETVCGPKGKATKGDKCDPAGKDCASGLVCGVSNVCRIACAHDQMCKDKGFDFCLKKPAAAAFGHCFHYMQ